jgi:hypothetical protein
MSGLIGFLNSNGTDLSYIFLSGTNATNSGYLIGTKDLSSIFKGTTAGSINTYNVGYIMSSGLDMSTFFEPLKVDISNSIFSVPALAANSWTSITSSSGLYWSFSGSVIVGNVQATNTTYPWNTVSLSSIIPSCSQYLGLQYGTSSITQNITLQNRKYVLNFWIIPRNKQGNTTFSPITMSSTTRCIVSIGANTILTYAPPSTTSATWVKLSVEYTNSTPGSYALKFLNNTTGGADSTFLITGVYMTVF